MKILFILFLILLLRCTEELKEVSFSDIDGNVYQAVVIGDQIWMAENYRVTRFNDGTPLNYIDPLSIFDDSAATFCWYNHDSINIEPYGGLYNWYCINDSRFPPKGWHIPSSDEWKVLIDNLGTNAGGKLKEEGALHWADPNEGATNETGFSAVGGGQGGPLNFWDKDSTAYYWLSDHPNVPQSMTILKYNTGNYSSYGHSLYGRYSVRLIKD